MLPPCHPERSTAASNASCRAQSKDPYISATLSSRIKAFSPWSRRPTNPQKLPDEIVVKVSGKGSFDSARSFARAPLRMTVRVGLAH
jgi:hypothetical protein